MTVEYRFDNGACVPVRVHTIVISAQHKEEVSLEQIRKDLHELVIKEVIPGHFLDNNTIYYLNPCGIFLSFFTIQ